MGFINSSRLRFVDVHGRLNRHSARLDWRPDDPLRLIRLHLRDGPRPRACLGGGRRVPVRQFCPTVVATRLCGMTSISFSNWCQKSGFSRDPCAASPQTRIATVAIRRSAVCLRREGGRRRRPL
jgi:hypothetical protein